MQVVSLDSLPPLIQELLALRPPRLRDGALVFGTKALPKAARPGSGEQIPAECCENHYSDQDDHDRKGSIVHDSSFAGSLRFSKRPVPMSVRYRTLTCPRVRTNVPP